MKEESSERGPCRVTRSTSDSFRPRKFAAGERVWVMSEDEGFAYGLFHYELRRKVTKKDGSESWEAECLGFFEDPDGTMPLVEKDIPEQRMVHLERPQQWRPKLGDMVLAWKVIDNQPPGAWWVARVVRAEWALLFENENDTVYTVQWFTPEGWEPDQAEWERTRLLCLLPFPSKIKRYLEGNLE
eukprot:RCo012688